MHEAALRRSPVFAPLSDAALAALAERLVPRLVAPGATVWFEGEPSDALAYVVDGGLTVTHGVQEVGSIAAGELVGEVGTFFGEPRGAMVAAFLPTSLLVLSRASLLELRAAAPEAYDAVLDNALDTVSRRLEAVGRKVARHAGAEEAPVGRVSAALARLFGGARREEGGAPTPLVPALSRLPVLRRAGEDVLHAIAAAMRPRRLRLHEVLLLEGNEGDSAFVIVEGEVAILRASRSGRSRRLARVGDGAVIGTGGLLGAERRSASARVVREGWAWELTRAAHRALRGEAGRAWRESLLAWSQHQLHQSSAELAELKGGTSAVDRARLRRAATHLAAVRGASGIPEPWGGEVPPSTSPAR